MGIRGSIFISLIMIFSKKNAGKWVASKNNRVIATNENLAALMKKISVRKDKDDIGYDRVPRELHFVGGHGIRVS